jgi:hypothetical protein
VTKANFLPQSYLHEQQAQRRKRRHYLLVALALSAAGIACWSSTYGLRPLEHDTAALRAEVGDLRHRREVLLTGTPEKVRVLNDLEARQRLIAPVSPAALMATVAAAMPPSMGLSSLIITTPPPQAGDDNHSGSASARPAPGPDRRPGDDAGLGGTIRIGMTGLAPSDIEAAHLIHSLSEHPAFQNVRLTYTHAIETCSRPMREFHIEAEVPLDRRYVATGPKTEAMRAP